MPLERVIEQQRARRIIESMVRENRLPHALLFWGSAGIGKSVAAMELARWLNCEQHPDGPCGTCESCVKFRTLEHPHFSYQLPLPASALVNSEEGELTRVAAEQLAEIFKEKGKDPYRSAEYPGSQFILIGQIRSLLRWANIRSFNDKHRLALIDHADRLREEAGNALLKLLEEPPPRFILVLTAETPEDILPTLRSRCHSIEFVRLSTATIEHELRSRGFEETEELRRIVNLSGGNLSRALKYAEDPQQAAQLHDFAINVVRHSLTRSPIELNKIAEAWSRKDHAEQSLILEIVAAWLRDAAMLQQLGEAGEQRVIYSDRLDLLKKFVANCPRADFISAANAVEQARNSLESNLLPPLVIALMARKLYRAVHRRKPN